MAQNGSAKPEIFDFIVVGAGTAGALLASRLARSKKQPSVLLVEAGGKNDSKAVRADAERWLHRMVPGMNWGYNTIPLEGLDGRVISYDRGKGLGGSSAINFGVWTLGPKDDYDLIAKVVADEDWSWNNVQQRYKSLESYHADVQETSVAKYVDANPKNHGYHGPIKVGFATACEPQAKKLADIFYANGVSKNPDHNSGDPIGMSMCISTAHQGRRSTSADTLVDAPGNLRVLTDTEVARVVWKGTQAAGISTFDGQTFYADKEVILSCGSLDTPRILMHSGIGPVDDLKNFSIPIVKANDNVGAHLKDHQHVWLSALQKTPTDFRTEYYKSKELQAAARAQWEKDGTGPLSEYATTLAVAFEKLPHLAETAEFQDLPKEQQEHLLAPTVPHYEYLVNTPWLPHFLDPDNAVAGLSTAVLLLNQRSTGTVKLQSSDPRQPLIFDPNCFSDPFDRRVAVDAMKEVLKIMRSPQYMEDIASIQGPKSDSDEDILAYWRANCESTWHMMGTARMGKDDSEAVVDKDLRVFGVEKLRVADMSIIPVVSK